jgi:hypothetical protein
MDFCESFILPMERVSSAVMSGLIAGQKHLTFMTRGRNVFVVAKCLV